MTGGVFNRVKRQAALVLSKFETILKLSAIAKICEFYVFAFKKIKIKKNIKTLRFFLFAVCNHITLPLQVEP
jgi:hypothetical protein